MSRACSRSVSYTHLDVYKRQQWEGDANYRSECYVAARNNDLPDDHFYRIDSYDCYDNIGLWMEKPCIQFFNSVVTPSIMDFYPRVGEMCIRDRFCRLGSPEEIRPVRVSVWLKVEWMRPSAPTTLSRPST